MNFTAGNVIKTANTNYSNKKGASFVATSVPLLMGAVIISIIEPLVGTGVLGFLFNVFINGVIMYMVYKMTLNLVRGLDIGFDQSLAPFSNVIKFLGVIAVFTILSQLLGEVLNLIFDSEAVFAEAIVISQDQLSVDIDYELIFSELLPMFIISFIIMFFIQLKFYITQYLIVDEVDFVDAFKESWIKTKGKIWRIIKVNLYMFAIFLAFSALIFILGYILSISAGTLFLFIIILLVLVFGYLIPYIYILQATLYEFINESTETNYQETEIYESEEVYDTHNDF